MATLVRDIVRRALAALGELAAGEQPTGHNASDGVEALQSLLLGLAGMIPGGRFYETATSTSYTAVEGNRITVTSPGAVTLPTTISDSWASNSSRPPRDLTKVQILASGSNVGIWLYSATKGEWGQVDSLAITSEIPFGPEWDAGLAAMLAEELSPLYPNSLQPRTAALAAQTSRAIRSKLKIAEAYDWTRPDWEDDQFAPYPVADYL